MARGRAKTARTPATPRAAPPAEAPAPIPPGYPIATVSPESPLTVEAEENAASDHAKLVAALATHDAGEDEPEERAPTLPELLAADIKAANRDGRFGDAGTLETFAVRWGETINALAQTRAIASPELATALAQLAELHHGPQEGSDDGED